MKEKILSVLIAVLLLTIVFSGCTEETKTSKTIYVDDGGGKDFTSIQDAINASNPGDTVYVYSGTYDGISITKTINLMGEDKNTTIIDGDGCYVVVSISVDHVAISGFTIHNSGGKLSVIGILMNSNCSITNNIIENSKQGLNLPSHSKSNIISGNTIQNISQYAMYIWFYSNNNVIFGNTIKNNRDGIYFEESSNNNIIYHNNLINNDKNAQDRGDNNTWYNTTLKEGNYLDDYTGVDENPKDGIGDTPYNITDYDGNAQNQDLYPLMEPVDI